MTNKKFGRVGDSPIIGAGTYATDKCAVSGTGWGEFYIRAAVAHDICARMEYRGDSLATAAEEVVNGVVVRMGGDGGAIAMDAEGNIAMPFNSPGMHRGWIRPDGSRGHRGVPDAGVAGEGRRQRRAGRRLRPPLSSDFGQRAKRNSRFKT
jgi:beta-aspartyl-peptidase (threonine type)